MKKYVNIFSYKTIWGINYINNKFNIKRTTNPNQNPYKTIKNSFYPQKIFNLENLSNQNPKNIRFCPNDQSINFPIVCKDSDIFIRLE